MRVVFPFWLLAASLVRASFWMEDVAHQGIAAFNPDKTYTVFRNVRDYGAKGDGNSDDTAAINAAISAGNRCGGYGCVGATISPAVVYFPPGTYVISSPIIGLFYTQIIGDPNDMPIIKGASTFPEEAQALLDADPYLSNGSMCRFSMEQLHPGAGTDFLLSYRTQFHLHQCLLSTSPQHCVRHNGHPTQGKCNPLAVRPGYCYPQLCGSGGMLTDLVFHGGKFGAQFGSQQYTVRNLTFYGSQTAILQIWNWGFTYKSLSINDCVIGLNMSSPDVGSVTLLDSSFTNVETAIIMGRYNSSATGLGSLMIQNVEYTNVPTVLEDLDGNAVLVGNTTGAVFERGYAKYYERSKPQYESYPASSFLSARSYYAMGDGVTDDTQALNNLFQAAASSSTNIAFLDAGYYLVTDTIYIPPNARIVGEGLSAVIMGAGDKFSDASNPYPVVQIGRPGEIGYIEMSDVIVSTQGPTAGAIAIQYNLKTPILEGQVTPDAPPSGLWDVHVRIGGFGGSKLQVAECLINPNVTNVLDPACIAGYMSMHITPSAGNLYMENNWLWVADHDIEDWNNTRIDVFVGRGFLIEGSNIWLVGSAVEHHTLYQYQLVNATDVWMGQIQTETPYYQPNPPAPYPFTQVNTELYDPDFIADCPTTASDDESSILDLLPGNPPCAMAWALRIIGGKDVMVFGAGLYSFFNNYNTSCSTNHAGENCQARIVSIQNGTDTEVTGSTTGLQVYNLNTIGSVSMLTNKGEDVAFWDQTIATYASTVGIFRDDGTNVSTS
ncbi:pectate lyase superfamily protein-domain-containing protein [Apiosordaria backusii]|uniref:Pectate lyase superfamily protein-domain-containing protein n=1 Tax=Apiosordaria backusii TaxID=314023 RepID=A0AA40E8D5_9PEZI|nr:pectate lyase superfamily protein-domain-containing protein [Apiosordaria backusii]